MKDKEEKPKEVDFFNDTMMDFLDPNLAKLKDIKQKKEAYLEQEKSKMDNKKKERQIKFEVKMPDLETFDSDVIFLQENDY